jgi:hypothetical protein
VEKITCPVCKKGVLSEWAPQYVKDAWKCNAAKCQTIFKTMPDWHVDLAKKRIVLTLAQLDRTTGEWTGKYERSLQMSPSNK